MRLAPGFGLLALGGLCGCWPLDDRGRSDHRAAAGEEPASACAAGPWSRRMSGGQVDGAMVASVAAAGRIAVAGVLREEMDVGAQQPLVPVGGQPAVYAVLVDSAGETRWARLLAVPAASPGPSSDLRPLAVAVDAADGVVVAGRLGLGAWIDGELVVGSVPGTGFLVRLGEAGRTDYLALWWGTGTAEVAVLVSDGQGGVVVGGSFIGTLRFGSAALVSAAYDWQPFLLSVDHAGVVQWSHQYASGSGLVTALARYPDGDLAVAGTFRSWIDLGGGVLGPGPERNDRDVFLARLDGRGEHRWSRVWGDAKEQAGPRLGTGVDGDLALGGPLRGSLALGPGAVVASADPEGDAFAARLDGAGDVRFARVLGGVGGESVAAVALADDGTLQLVGDFSGSIAFGPELALVASGERDLFAATLAGDGRPRGAAAFGAVGAQSAAGGGSLCADPVLVGACRGPIAFDPRAMLSGEAAATDLCVARIGLEPAGR